MATLSWPTFLIMVAAIAVGCVSQFYARDHGMRGFQQARELEDELQRTYRDISEGAKELRISRPRRHAIFHGRLKGTAASIRDIQIRSINLFTIANVLGSSLFFAVIGLALAYQFFWPDVDRTTLSGVVLVLLYVKGPLEHVIGDLPIVTRAQVAFSRIADLSRQFESLEPHVAVHPGGPAASEMQSIGLKGVRYAFPAGDGEPFVPGPVDLCLEQGESVFIVGDNGSGKTTLIKLLLGLYAPQAGEVLLDGAPVTEATRDDYRQLFTTIFADYHLFEDLPQVADELPAEAARYLQRLELAHKVSVREGRFSTLDLSTGQRKRLALIQAWLEGRPVLVFGEWAADQDPAFRQIFYTKLLPDLKRLGRTLVVISHDDRYFQPADRVVWLDHGRIVDQRSLAREVA